MNVDYDCDTNAINYNFYSYYSKIKFNLSQLAFLS